MEATHFLPPPLPTLPERKHSVSMKQKEENRVKGPDSRLIRVKMSSMLHAKPFDVGEALNVDPAVVCSESH